MATLRPAIGFLALACGGALGCGGSFTTTDVPDGPDGGSGRDGSLMAADSSSDAMGSPDTSLPEAGRDAGAPDAREHDAHEPDVREPDAREPDASEDTGTGKEGGAGDGGAPSPCPVTPPTAGSACSSGAGCEYYKSGESNPDVNCNLLYTCESSAWENTSAMEVCPPQSECPTTYGAIVPSSPCVEDQLECAYPQGTCICTNESDGVVKTKYSWECLAATSTCPSPRPRLGTSCSMEGTACNYGACSGGIEIVCMDGYWQMMPVAC